MTTPVRIVGSIRRAKVKKGITSAPLTFFDHES